MNYHIYSHFAGAFSSELTLIMLTIPAVLIALMLHEVAHGYVAYRLGDPTARSLGRLSLNPLKHIDPLGALCMVFFRFGWARPVPINTRYFAKPKRDMALTAVAGPVTNILLSFVLLLLFNLVRVLTISLEANDFTAKLLDHLLAFLYNAAYLNAGLAIFNMIPVPPLDGSRFMYVWLPQRLYFRVMQYEQYVSMFMFLLFIIDSYTVNVIGDALSTAISWVVGGLNSLLLLLPFF